MQQHAHTLAHTHTCTHTHYEEIRQPVLPVAAAAAISSQEV
jgi:hypothetical protein